jgi:Flp pilus assembly pilin Flp
MVTLAYRLKRLVVDTTGQDLIEYALLIGLIALVAVGAVTSVGTTLNGVFWQVIANGLANAPV